MRPDVTSARSAPGTGYTEGEIRALVSRAQEGDIEARNRIIEATTYRRRAAAVWAFKRRPSSGYDVGDLCQAAVFGEIRAIERFSDRFNASYDTHAAYHRKNAIHSYIHNHRDNIRRPAYCQTLLASIRREAHITGVSEDVIIARRGVKPSTLRLIRLSQNWSRSIDECLSMTGNNPIAADSTDWSELKLAILELPEKLRHIITRRLDGAQYTTIGRELGITKQGAWAACQEACKRLQKNMKEGVST